MTPSVTPPGDTPPPSRMLIGGRTSVTANTNFEDKIEYAKSGELLATRRAYRREKSHSIRHAK